MKKTNEIKTYKLIILAASGFFISNVLSILKLILELPERNILTLIAIPMCIPIAIALFIYYNKIKITKRRSSFIILAIAILIIIITSIVYSCYIINCYL